MTEFAMVVSEATVHDGKFRFRFNGKAVWGYVIDLLPGGSVVKLDGEHTYLWPRDPRIEQPIVARLLSHQVPEARLWMLARYDDRGTGFLIEENLDEAAAKSMVADFEGRGHKQSYEAFSYNAESRAGVLTERGVRA